MLGGLDPGLGDGLLGLLGGGRDHVAGLLLGQSQQLLDAGTETAVGGPLDLPQLTVGLGDLTGEFQRTGVEFLDAGSGITPGGLQGGDSLLHLRPVETAHDDLESMGALFAGHYSSSLTARRPGLDIR